MSQTTRTQQNYLGQADDPAARVHSRHSDAFRLASLSGPPITSAVSLRLASSASASWCGVLSDVDTFSFHHCMHDCHGKLLCAQRIVEPYSGVHQLLVKNDEQRLKCSKRQDDKGDAAMMAPAEKPESLHSGKCRQQADRRRQPARHKDFPGNQTKRAKR